MRTKMHLVCMCAGMHAGTHARTHILQSIGKQGKLDTEVYSEKMGMFCFVGHLSYSRIKRFLFQVSIGHRTL